MAESKGAEKFISNRGYICVRLAICQICVSRDKCVHVGHHVGVGGFSRLKNYAIHTSRPRGWFLDEKIRFR